MPVTPVNHLRCVIRLVYHSSQFTLMSPVYPPKPIWQWYLTSMIIIDHLTILVHGVPPSVCTPPSEPSMHMVHTRTIPGRRYVRLIVNERMIRDIRVDFHVTYIIPQQITFVNIYFHITRCRDH